MLKISEVLANPSGSDTGGEYVVLINTGTRPVAISGWKIKTGAGKQIGVSGSIESGGSIKVMTGSVALRNTGDTLSLISSSGETVDQFTYAVAADGQLLQPAKFLTPELRAELFESFTADATAVENYQTGLGADTILLGAGAAVILALLAIHVLKKVHYDEIIKNPFARSQ